MGIYVMKNMARNYYSMGSNQERDLGEGDCTKKATRVVGISIKLSYIYKTQFISKQGFKQIKHCLSDNTLSSHILCTIYNLIK